MTRWTGLLLVALSALGFATLPIFAKFAYGQGLNVVTILAWRFALAALILWAWVALNRRSVPWPPLRDVGLLLLMGASGYSVMSVLYVSSVQYIPAGLAAALLYTYPAMVSVQVALLGWEPMSGGRALALLGTGAGTALVLLAGEAGAGVSLLGVGLVLGAALTYSVYITLGSRVIARVSAPVATATVCTAAALVFFVYGLAAGRMQPVGGTAGWWPLVGQALVATVMAVLSFFAGIQRIGPARASIVSTLEPVAAVGLGAMLFGERLGPLQWAGGGLVLLSLLLLQISARAKSANPA